MVTFRPMTEDEFAAFKAFMSVEYEQDVARGMGLPVEEVRERAQQQLESLMKDGLSSQEHLYWKVVAPEGGVVGDLWVMLQPRRQSFIYYIGINEAQRGKGYGEETMRHLEDEMRSRGVTHIALNVFGDNAVARRLYERVGYQTAAIYMNKAL
jgi:ribosomal protein S18 acetylase RimI-like enzyme